MPINRHSASCRSASDSLGSHASKSTRKATSESGRAEISSKADTDFGNWLRDRKNNRQIPHRLEGAGYVSVRNPGPKDGMWKIGGKRQVIYARHELDIRDRIAAANSLIERSR